MGEALVACLTQGCLSLVLAITSPAAPARGQGGRNPALQLRALDALRTLIVALADSVARCARAGIGMRTRVLC